MFRCPICGNYIVDNSNLCSSCNTPIINLDGNIFKNSRTVIIRYVEQDIKENNEFKEATLTFKSLPEVSVVNYENGQRCMNIDLPIVNQELKTEDWYLL